MDLYLVVKTWVKQFLLDHAATLPSMSMSSPDQSLSLATPSPATLDFWKITEIK
jgi:hypothetical protein